MKAVVCQFRDEEQGVTYLRANKEGTEGMVDQIGPVERITLYDGEYSDTLGTFLRLAEAAGGLESAEQDKMERFHQSIGFSTEEPASEEEDVEQEVDARTPSGRSEPKPKGIRGFTPWRIQ